MDSLTDEQLLVFKFIKEGKHIYLRGAAGTGKTYTIQHLKQWLQGHNKNIGITAMTGCAALLIQGSTLHSFLGIGLANKTASELAAANAVNKKKIIKRLIQLNVLVIDEVSMLDKDLFEKISDYLKIIRKNDKPFGGVQLVLCGDFCQLPPVKGTYCFMSNLWKELSLQECCLTKSFRHHKDGVFRDLLESMRVGQLTEKHIELLNQLQQTKFNYGIKPTRLYPLCSNIEEINQHYFKKLLKKQALNFTYRRTMSEIPVKSMDWFYKLDVPESIHLCVGSQVYVTHNINMESGIVNGTRGVITSMDERSVTIQKTDGIYYTVSMYRMMEDENELVWVEFMPLRLAFALTIHKSQGMTLDAIEIDLGENIFEYGQAYTAISRAKTLDSIRIVHFNPKAIKTHSLVRQFYEELNVS